PSHATFRRRCPIPWHVAVEQANVWALAQRSLDRRRTVRYFGADDDAAAFQRHSYAGPRRRVVVRDQNRLRQGSTTSIFVPAFGRDAMLSSPPSAWTRSVIVARP